MGDWVGLGMIVLVLLGALFGMARLGGQPRPMSPEEFERRAQEGRGAMSAGVMAGMHALQKLMNPKAAEAVEVLKDLREGHYEVEEGAGEGDAPGVWKKGLEASEEDGEGDDA